MLQIAPVAGGLHRVYNPKSRFTHYLGPKPQAEALMSRISKARNFAMRATDNNTFVVVDLSKGGSKKIRREQVRYESASIKRAERVLEAFLAGEI